MLRLLLISLLCAFFAACSSDDSEALSSWFNDQGIATSYGSNFQEFALTVKSVAAGYDSSAYMVSSYAALGNANGIEQVLFFGWDSVSSIETIKLRIDSTFYADFKDALLPNTIDAQFYWSEKTIEHDTTLSLSKFEKFDIITLEKMADTFFVKLPSILRVSNMAIKTTTQNIVLRFAVPKDIPRVAQKTNILDFKECERCLYSGARESLDVAFELKTAMDASKTVVFAQLIVPTSGGTANNEFEHPLPVYIYRNGALEDYRVDTTYVNEHSTHPNLLFNAKEDLTLQVTNSLRRNALNFTLKLGSPMLKPKSFYFNNNYEKVFADRFIYSRYDFGDALAEGAGAKLRVWFADYDGKK